MCGSPTGTHDGGEGDSDPCSPLPIPSFAQNFGEDEAWRWDGEKQGQFANFDGIPAVDLL